MEIRFMKTWEWIKINELLNLDIEGRIMLNRYSVECDNDEQKYREPYIVAEDSEWIVWYLSYSISQQLKSITICGWYVAPLQRGKWVYRDMWNYMMKNIQMFRKFIIFRSTREDNIPIINMCKEDWFIQYWVKPHSYYDPDEDRLMDGLMFYKKYE